MISIKGMAAASAALWGGAVLATGVANLIRPRYGEQFLRVVASVYPGYGARRTAGQVLVGTAYAVVDGATAGALFAWAYNRFAGESRPIAAAEPAPLPIRTAV